MMQPCVSAEPRSSKCEVKAEFQQFRRCWERIRRAMPTAFAVLWLMFPAIYALSQESSWVGKQVVTKTGKGKVLDLDGTVLQAEDLLHPTTFRVLAENSGRIQVKSFDGVVGWMNKSDTLLHDEALKYFTERIKENPDDADAYAGRGRTRKWEDGGLDPAIADFTEAIRLKPKDTTFYSIRAYHWSAKGDHDKANADYTEIIRINPKNVPAFIERGKSWSYEKKYDTAIADFNEAIRLDPKKAYSYNLRANTWYFKKDYAKAIADYTQAITLNPKLVYLYNNRGSVYFRTKEYEKAMLDFDQAEKVDRDAARTYVYRAELLATCADAKYRDGKKAVEQAGKALKLTSYADGTFYETMAAALAETGDFANAILWQEKALKRWPLQNDEGSRRRLEMYRKEQPYRQE